MQAEMAAAAAAAAAAAVEVVDLLFEQNLVVDVAYC